MTKISWSEAKFLFLNAFIVRAQVSVQATKGFLRNSKNLNCSWIQDGGQSNGISLKFFFFN
jgi:hypothetical protein